METTFAGVDMALPEDEDAIFDVLVGLHKENGIFTYSEAKTRMFIRLGTQQQGGIIGVIRGPEGIEGTVGLVLDQWWYTDDWCLSERWCYVPVQYRKNLTKRDIEQGRSGTHANRLIEFSKWVADQLGVPLQMGVMSTRQTQAKMKLYRRKMAPIGELYFYNRGLPVVTGSEEVHSGR